MILASQKIHSRFLLAVTCAFVFIFASIEHTLSQTTFDEHYADSLKNELPKSEREVHLKQLKYIAYTYAVLYKNDSAAVYALEGLEKSEAAEDINSQIDFLTRLAHLFGQSDAEKAKQYNQQAAKLRIKRGEQPYREYSSLFRIYARELNVDSALIYFNLTSKSIPDDKADYKASNLDYMAHLYNSLGDMSNAIKYFQRLNKLAVDENLEYYIAHSKSSIGSVYRNLGKLDSARYFLEKAHENLELFTPSNQASSCFQLAFVYNDLKLTERADDLFSQGWQIAKEIKEDYLFGSLCNDYAGSLIGQNRYREAAGLLDTCLMANLRSRNNINISNSYQNQVSAYYGLEDFESAYYALESLEKLRDSLVDEQNRKDVIELEVAYQSELKDQQLVAKEQQLKQSNTILVLLIVTALLLTAGLFFLFAMARQRKKINEKLRKLDQAKSDFFANISHELRTPLTLIRGPLEKIIKNESNVNQDIQLAYENSGKLAGLVNEILELAKLESGELQLLEQNIEIETYLKRIFYSCSSYAALRGVDWVFEYNNSGSDYLSFDGSKFERVINNLLSNALKFTEKGDMVSMKVDVRNDRLNIVLEDTGQGIDEKDITNIFKRYYQSEAGAKNPAGGSGIGLAYVYEIVRVFGGQINVESKVGVGSKFMVSIPVKKGQPISGINVKVASNTLEKESFSAGSQSNLNILVVEDNADMSKYIAGLLDSTYNCHPVYDGQEALEILSNGEVTFDLIISDVMMPRMDGFHFLEKVKENAKFQQIPFVLLTARAMEVDKLRGLRLGVDDYITKPFNSDELLARVENLIINKQQRIEYIQEEEINPVEKIPKHERLLLEKARSLVESNLSNPHFKVASLASEMNYSRRQLGRIINRLTGLSPVEFIREIRLLRARQLIETGVYPTIAEVRYEVGFDNASYFTKKFSERFGVAPSEMK